MSQGINNILTNNINDGKMTITVKLDSYGKIFIPKAIRTQFTSDEFEISVKKEVVELKPLKSPTALFGTLKKIDRKLLDDIHGEEHEFDA